MPFGLLSAPSAFQQFMNKVFYDLLNFYIVIYFDDILVYSNNLKNHKKHVKEVLRRLWGNKLYVSPTKCVFYQNRVEFLGFILGSDGLKMDKSKIQIIRDWPAPRRVKDVQSFLGFTNF